MGFEYSRTINDTLKAHHVHTDIVAKICSNLAVAISICSYICDGVLPIHM